MGSSRCVMRCGRPRLLPAAGRLNAGLAPLEPGLRGAVAARGHSARLVTSPLLLRLPRSSRGRDPRDARPVLRGASGMLWNRTSVCRGACVFFDGSKVSLVWAMSLAGADWGLGPCSTLEVPCGDRAHSAVESTQDVRVLSCLILGGFSCSHSESIVLWVLERRG